MSETDVTESRGGVWFRTINCGLRLHRIPDAIVQVNLGEQLARNVDPDWYAVVMFADGRGIALGATNETSPPLLSDLDWMARAAVALNRDMHEDGHWIVAWCPTQRLPVLLWRDGDGDAHCAVEIVKDVRDPRGLHAMDKHALLDRASEALAAVRGLAVRREMMKRHAAHDAQRRGGGARLPH